MSNIYTIGHGYRNRLAQKESWFWGRRPLGGPTPGWNGDADQRPFRFDKWAKRPRLAIRLYWNLRK